MRFVSFERIEGTVKDKRKTKEEEMEEKVEREEETRMVCDFLEKLTPEERRLLLRFVDKKKKRLKENEKEVWEEIKKKAYAEFFVKQKRFILQD